jgi:VWFA-related protein
MRRVPAVVLFLLLCGAAPPGAASQQDAAGAPPAPPQPTFRAGINFVRVDVIVTDRRGNPDTSLALDDFEVLEDGRPQAVEQFKLVRADRTDGPDIAPPRELRTRDDELIDAQREDVRVFAILLDDYHVRRERSLPVRQTLVRFIRQHVRPNDLLAVMYPLTSVRTLTFTRDHESVTRALQSFEGRRGEYTPRNAVEQEHWRRTGGGRGVEAIRNAVSMDALRALSVRLGSLREGRKSLIYVSESLPAGGFNYLSLRDIARDANWNNVSIYPFDPTGLTTSPGRSRQDTLRYLADETDGRAIVNRNTFDEGLAQIARDSSVYYLLGYSSTHSAPDGKFHEIEVRVKKRGLDVRARKGYWAITEEDAVLAANPPTFVVTPVQRALATIGVAEEGRKYVRSWVGSERGENGRTKVTVVWEVVPDRNRQEADQPGRLSLSAAAADGTVPFDGDAPVSGDARHITFDAPPGRLELRMTVEAAASGDTLDRDVVSVEVPDLGGAGVSLSTPRVFAARTANEFRALAENAEAIPTPRRQFVRTERLLIRMAAHGESPAVTAALLGANSTRLADVPVTAAQAGGTHQIQFNLGGLAPGDYVIEVKASGDGGEATELVPLRVGS